MANAKDGMNPQLHAAYERWMVSQVKASAGERRQRLKKGLSFSLKQFVARIFWPAVGSFDGWHAEYEVVDFKDGYRYLDLAKPSVAIKICIEVDDKGSHGQQADAYKFSDDRFRQNDLVIDDWKVLRFSLQSIMDQPRRCQQQLMHALAKWGFESDRIVPALLPTEMAIYSFIENRAESFSPAALAKAVGIHRNTAVKHLKSLVEKGKVMPDVGTKTGSPTRRYRCKKGYL
ncbi:helix-turn-helix domain-containing protein [Cohnella suwonensis]|uniref:Helix-turn-helix domain-containing protein n=1 Tax=Cohnella suwonensis TaxID=696072 RepID=A0ABW0M0X4_9BACL